MKIPLFLVPAAPDETVPVPPVPGGGGGGKLPQAVLKLRLLLSSLDDEREY